MIKEIKKIREWHKIVFPIIITVCFGIMLSILGVISLQQPPILVVKPIKTITTAELLKSIEPRLDPGIIKIIAEEIDISSKKYSLPPELVIAIMKKESAFNPLATSKSNAVGLMQILERAHPDKTDEYDDNQLYHININIDMGCRIFREYYDASGNGKKLIEKALKKYVGGDVKNYVADIFTTFIELSMYKESLGIEEKKEEVKS